MLIPKSITSVLYRK